ncbi:hypothetical protein KCU88_g348, partial [Aureobasidium melanogenum]
MAIWRWGRLVEIIAEELIKGELGILVVAMAFTINRLDSQGGHDAVSVIVPALGVDGRKLAHGRVESVGADEETRSNRRRWRGGVGAGVRSSLPIVIFATLVFDNKDDSASSSKIRSSKPLVKLAFSTMVATVCGGALYRRASARQSNWMAASLAASQTCISSYGWIRVWSTCRHDPVCWRNETDDGVRLLARSWVSINAVLRWDVIGDDSVGAGKQVVTTRGHNSPGLTARQFKVVEGEAEAPDVDEDGDGSEDVDARPKGGADENLLRFDEFNEYKAIRHCAQIGTVTRLVVTGRRWRFAGIARVGARGLFSSRSMEITILRNRSMQSKCCDGDTESMFGRYLTWRSQSGLFKSVKLPPTSPTPLTPTTGLTPHRYLTNTILRPDLTIRDIKILEILLLRHHRHGIILFRDDTTTAAATAVTMQRIQFPDNRSWRRDRVARQNTARRRHETAPTISSSSSTATTCRAVIGSSPRRGPRRRQRVLVWFTVRYFASSRMMTFADMTTRSLLRDMNDCLPVILELVAATSSRADAATPPPGSPVSAAVRTVGAL